jgi:hypothetical protein
MGITDKRPAGIPAGAVAGAAIGIAGTAAGITLVFLGMRAVMDIGGFCAEGGPYEIATHCPDGATPALLLGIFGGMASAAVGSAFGIRIGGIWATVPVLAWAGLFGSLGWNFMDYGVFNAPDGIELGWAIPGIMFWVMAAVPLLGVGSFLVAGGASRLLAGSQADPPPVTRAMPGPSLRGPSLPGPSRPPRTWEPMVRPPEPSRPVAPAPSAPTAQQRALAGIAADFGAAVARSMDETPLAELADGAPPGARPAGEPGPEPSFTEGTQALLDRLERLADMRDRGLLDPDEYETAKAAIMAELEERS